MSVHFSVLQRFSLRARIIALISALVLSITLLLSWVASREAAIQLKAGIGHASAETAYQMVDKLNRTMDARVKEVQLLLGIQALTEHPDSRVIRRQLEQLQSNYEVVSWIGVTDASGTVIAGTDGILEDHSISHRPVFLEGRQGLWVGDVHKAQLLSQLLPSPEGEELQFVDIAAPLYDSEGAFSGVLAVHISWEWAAYVKASMQLQEEYEQHIDLMLLSANNTVLLGPSDMLGLQLPKIAQYASLSPTWSLHTWPDGKRYVTGIARSHGYGDFSGLGWTAVSRQPVATAFAPAQRLNELIRVTGILAAFIFIIIGWALASRLVAPLTRLSLAADKINATQTHSEIQIETGSPELKRLSISMRNMVERLLDQHQTISRLEDLANTDPLTGLANRSFLNHYLRHALPDAERQGLSMVVIALDLDGFKKVNDELGHHAGDLLLIEITQRLEAATRSGDVVARLGGDEFVMVLKSSPEATETLAKEVSERLLHSIAEPVHLPSKETARVGCSVGAACWPQHNHDIKQVMQLADAALYKAKNRGKHQLVIHGAAE